MFPNRLLAFILMGLCLVAPRLEPLAQDQRLPTLEDLRGRSNRPQGSRVATASIPENRPPWQEQSVFDKAYWQWVEDIRENHTRIRERLEALRDQAIKGEAEINNDDVYLLAVCYYYEGEINRALTLIQTLVGQRGYEKKSHYLGALCFVRRFETTSEWSPEIIRNLYMCLFYAPDDPRVWIGLHSAVMNCPSPAQNKVVRDLTRYIGIHFNDHFGRPLILGTLAQVSYEYGKAEQLFFQARNLAPEHPAPWHALVWLYRSRGDIQSANIALRKLADLDWNPQYQAELDREIVALRRYKRLLAGEESMLPTRPRSGATYRLPWSAGFVSYLSEPRRYSPAGRTAANAGRGQHAYNFLMPPRTPILAMRDGVVSEVKQTGEDEGSKEFRNYLVIKHGDGTYARYFNFVNASAKIKGTPVRAGDVIAYSERNRFTRSAHLRVEVTRKTGFPRFGGPKIYSSHETIPFRFEEWEGLDDDMIYNNWHISMNRPWQNQRMETERPPTPPPSELPGGENPDDIDWRDDDNPPNDGEAVVDPQTLIEGEQQ